MAYSPSAVPDDARPGLKAWLADQLRQIANELSSPSVRSIRLGVLGAEPAKYANGDIVYADGSNWDPGSGAGFYGREGGAWVKF